MFAKSQCSLTLICLTIVTLTRSLPSTYMKKIDSDAIITALNCTFLSIYANDTEHYCPQLEIGPYEDRFDFIRYACMELYDVSLQLCEIKDMRSDNLAEIPSAMEFCKKLKFYDQRATKSIGRSADTAVIFFSRPANCEKLCIIDNFIHPICKAIYSGNAALIKIAEERSAGLASKQIPHSDVSATTHQHSDATATETQLNFHRVPALNDKDPTKEDPAKSVKHAETKEERKPDISSYRMVAQPLVKSIPGDGLTDAVKELPDSIPAVIPVKKNELEKVHMENPPSNIPEIKKDVETQSFEGDQTFEEQSPLDSGPQTLAKALPDTSQSSSPAISTASVSPSPNPEAFYKYSAADQDDNRDSSKDVDLENEGNGEEYTGSSSLTLQGGSNSYGSDEPVDNQIITSNVYSSNYAHGQDSHFFAYFLTMVVICIVGYLVFHNKQKIIALALEGRRMQGSRRRPNTSSYKKLDSNLEEAVTSNCSSSSVTHVIF